MEQEEEKPKRRKRVVAMAVLVVVVIIAGLAALALFGPVPSTRRFAIRRLLARQRLTPQFELGWSGKLLAWHMTDAELAAISRGQWGEEPRWLAQDFLVDLERSLPPDSARRAQILGLLRDMALDLEARDTFRAWSQTAYRLAVPMDAHWPIAFEMMADENDSVSAYASLALMHTVSWFHEDLRSMIVHVCTARMVAGDRFGLRHNFSNEQAGGHTELVGDEVFGDWLHLLIQAFAAEFPQESPDGATGLPAEMATDLEVALESVRLEQAQAQNREKQEVASEAERDREMCRESLARSAAALERLHQDAIGVPRTVWLEWARTHFECSDEELALLGEFIAVARQEGREFRESVLLLGLLNACPSDEEARDRLGSLRPDLLRLTPPRALDGEEGSQAVAETKEQSQ